MASNSQQTASAEAIKRDIAELVRPPRRERVTDVIARAMYVVAGNGTKSLWRAETSPYMVEPTDCLASRLYDAVIFVGPARTGKALDIATPIATPEGWTTMGKLQPGDEVFGDDGKPTKVVFATEHQLNRKCYRVCFSDGSSIIADEEHLWGVERFYWNKPNWRQEVRSTAELLKDFTYSHTRHGSFRCRYHVRMPAPLHLPEHTLEIDPYVLGVWLGDGSSRQATITSHIDDAGHYINRFESVGHEISISRAGKNTHFLIVDRRKRLTTHCQRGHDFSALGRTKTGACRECIRLAHWKRKYGVDRFGNEIPEPALFKDTLSSKLHRFGLYSNKHIPRKYLRASKEQRIELLRGLMDTDGSFDRRQGSVEFVTILDRLAYDFRELALSLGFKPSLRIKRTSWTYKGIKKYSSAYRITFPVSGEINPFSLPRKSNELTCCKADVNYRSIVRIEPVPTRPVKCIQVDNESHMYLAGDAMVPTHNTVSLIDGFITYKILNDPGDGMIVQITEDKAREYSKKRLERTFNASPELIAKLSARGHDNNVHDKTFRAGNYLAIKWPSKNVFASSDFQFVLLTDYDRMDSDIGGEGSPFALASKRTQTFGSTGITMAESSPGRLISDPDWERSEDEPHAAPPTTGILDLYNQGDRRRFYWQCPESKCRQWFQPVMENFSFEAARPFCPHCGCMIEKSQKRQLNLGGRWVPEGCWLDTAGVMHGHRRNTRIASFWMEGPAAAYQQWDSLVTKYRAAEKTYEDTDDQTALQSCTNVDWGRPYINRLAVTPRSSDLLMKRREEIERRTVPEGVRFLTAAVDVQGGKNRRFVVQIHGWGAGRETWVVDRFNISEDRGPNNDQEPRQISPASHPEDWDLLTRDVLNRTYKLADGTGRRMPVLAMAVDTGGEKGSGDESVTSQAYEWYRRLRASGLAGRVYLVKGASSAQGRVRITYPDNTKRKDRHSSATGDIPLHLLGTDQLKDVVASMLDREDPGAGYVHTPAWLGRWWFDEVTYEVRDAASGKWSRPGKRANEAFDLCVYNLAIFILIKAESIKWDSPPPWAFPWDENPLIIPAGVDPREHLPAIQQQPHSKRRKRVVKSSITRRR